MLNWLTAVDVITRLRVYRTSRRGDWRGDIALLALRGERAVCCAFGANTWAGEDGQLNSIPPALLLRQESTSGCSKLGVKGDTYRHAWCALTVLERQGGRSLGGYHTRNNCLLRAIERRLSS